ncbi:MAG: IS1634 family transposase [bacterium]
MAIIRKKFGNRVYLYEAICKRVDGKPRIVRQKYLGKPEDVLGLPKEEPRAIGAQVYDFGAITALLGIAEDLKFIEIIDGVLRKRKQGLSVGEYMLLAAINRVVAPRSKRQFWDWYRQTVLWRLFEYKRRDLTSQRFWDNMDLLTQKKIGKIEVRLNERLLGFFGIDLSCLIYDTTNFYTFINTLTHSRLPQRGHNKQRRDDLRQIGLALMVTRDFHIPLFHQVYEGNKVDVTQFRSVIQELVKRYKILAKGCEDVTLVFDKGNNSKDNQVAFDFSPYHFVGSLVITHHKDLLKIPKNRYQVVDKDEFPGLLAYRTEKQIFGKKRTLVLTFNPKLYEGQWRGILWTLKKKRVLLEKLQKKRLVLRAELEAEIKQIVRGQYIKEIIKWEIKEDKGVVFHWWFDRGVLAQIKRERLGKTILFTDNDDWDTKSIIAAYHGQYKIEHAFRQMKHPYFVSWYPMFHWTDQKIMVHGFYCVMALLLMSLLTKRVNENGIKISSEQLLNILNGIKEVEVIYPYGKAGARSEYVLTEVSEEQKKLYALLGLEKYSKKT